MRRKEITKIDQWTASPVIVMRDMSRQSIVSYLSQSGITLKHLTLELVKPSFSKHQFAFEACLCEVSRRIVYLNLYDDIKPGCTYHLWRTNDGGWYVCYPVQED
jgi:hypothetical protein